MLAQPIRHHGSTSLCPVAGTVPLARARRILRTNVTYIDHPSFRDLAARDTILRSSTDSVGDQAARPWQPLEWLDRLPTGAPEPRSCLASKKPKCYVR